MLSRVFQFAKEFLPPGLLNNLRQVKEVVNDKVSLKDDGFNSVWSSLATSCNYASPAHTDKDAFISCLLVSHKPSSYNTRQKYLYTMDEKICCHFVFPLYGKAVALRPGDMLFFNPLHYHCLSDRTLEFEEEKVYVTSFYMKSAQLGLNDNDIEVSEVVSTFL